MYILTIKERTLLPHTALEYAFYCSNHQKEDQRPPQFCPLLNQTSHLEKGKHEMLSSQPKIK